MKSSFAWRYANARKGKFQFRLSHDTNPMTGFSGNSSQPATHAALAAAGFGIANTVDIDSASLL